MLSNFQFRTQITLINMFLLNAEHLNIKFQSKSVLTSIPGISFSSGNPRALRMKMKIKTKIEPRSRKIPNGQFGFYAPNVAN